MCNLPNFEARDLEALSRDRKRGKKKAEAKTVEIVIPEQPLLENQL
jgi:hypothetical protein